jgi:ATP-dependent Clp protease ATP-binding subunit ClpC
MSITPMEPRATHLQVSFSDPRLNMTVGGRIFVRFAGYVGYILVIAATFTFLTSDISWLVWLGALLALFLTDRVLHRREADRLLSELPREGSVNLAHYLLPRAFGAVERAFDRHALTGGNLFLEMLTELLDTFEGKEALLRLDVPISELQAAIREAQADVATGAGSAGGVSAAEISGKVNEIMCNAYEFARVNRHRFVRIEDVISGILSISDPVVDRVAHMFSLTAPDFSRAALLSARAREVRRKFHFRPSRLFRGSPHSLPATVPGSLRGLRHRIMNRAWTSRPTPTLDKLGTDLTDLARRGSIGFMIGHTAEYDHLVAILARSSGQNALLIGEPGVGKETVVSHLAFALVKDRVPSPLFDKRLVSLSLGELAAAGGGAAGAGGSGSTAVETIISRVFDEIMRAGNVILYIPDFHEVVSGGSGAHLSLADAVMNAVKGGVVPVIAAATAREYRHLLEPRSDIKQAFELVHVEEVTDEDAESVLAHEAAILEAETGVMVSFAAIKKAVEVSRRYLHGDSLLPGSALNLLRDGMRLAVTSEDKVLEPVHVVKAAESRTNAPIHEARPEESESLLHLEDTIHESYIDQEEAVTAVADAIREYRSGVGREGGPIASFMFVGPTGVGKTELAKQIAKIQFGSEAAMIRFDMSEYQDKASFARFIGSADGETRGALTEAVREKPYAVVLLDEFEKAFPDIINLFLQVLDEGRLTDTLDRVIDFRNTIVIATSNAHAEYVLEASAQGESAASIAATLSSKLVTVFRPELINRFSKIIVFKNLEPAHVHRIAELQLKALVNDLGARGMNIVFSPEAVDLIAQLGYDRAYGARPLRRAIEEHVRAPLAKYMLAGAMTRGGMINVVAEDGKVVFH